MTHPTYHMVTVELLHDRGLVQKLNSLPHAGRLIDRLDGHSRFGFVLHYSLRDAFVHHAEGALAQFSVHSDLLPCHLPLIWDIHWCGTRDSGSPSEFIHPTQKTQWKIDQISNSLTLSGTEVLWIDWCIQDSVPQSVTVPVNTNSVSLQASLIADAVYNFQEEVYSLPQGNVNENNTY